MNLRRIATTVVIAAALGAAPVAAAPLGTAISYQGRLEQGGSLATGDFDFIFRLFDDPAAGAQVGPDVSLGSVAVSSGLFTVALDFGAGAFDGSARWLEIQVKGSLDADYTPLSPRQPITAAPYALHALSAPGGGGGPWTSSANGIEHPGNVAIGNVATPTTRLWVDGGTANVNPLVVSNNNTSWGALALRNDAVNGYGLYDAWSDRHYIEGKLGVGNANPATAIDITSNHQGLTVRNTGAPYQQGYGAAIVALGYDGLNAATSMGVYASSTSSRAVWGSSVSDLGVVGDNISCGNSGWLGGLNEGVYGQATTGGRYGGIFKNTAPGGVALLADGLAQVKTLQILGADLAESFPVREGTVEPGTVLMMDDTRAGRLRIADEPYCTRVAGVVSGANGLDAAVVLSGAAYENHGHAPVALSGRVWVKCDATDAPIRAGDLLTTSARAGHAMRARDRDRAYGATLGKAMTALEKGTGMVLVLVNLQ